MTTQAAKHQGRPSAWRPQHGQWFNAIVKRYNKPHPAGPFKASGYYSSDPLSRYVEGLDAEGDTWVFCLRQFRLEPIDRSLQCG